jgi:hypothetical protein
LICEGEGSDKSKRRLLDSILTGPNVHLLSHPSFEFTEKKRIPKFSIGNRKILLEKAVLTRRQRQLLIMAERHEKAQKLLSSYTFPLLFHKRTDPTHVRSLLLPQPLQTPERDPEVLLSHPSWYPVPSPEKNDTGSTGGTMQGRITCKHPAHQTDPPQIQRAYRSRWKKGILSSADASQIELRVAGLLSGEPAICRPYQLGADIHSERAGTFADLATQLGLGSLWSQLPTKTRRDCGKHANFADLFWSSAEAIQSTVLEFTGITLPLPFFQKIVDARPLSRPILWAWQHEQIATVKKQGFNSLPFTGQSRFFGEKSKKGRHTSLPVNEIINQPIQTFAGDINLRIQHFLEEIIDPSRCLVCLNIYDSVIIDSRDPSTHDQLRTEWLPAAVDAVATHDLWHMMSQRTGFSVPLSYELKVLHAMD